MAEQAPACTATQLEAAARRARPVRTEEANESHRRRDLRLRWDTDGRWLLISGRVADTEGAVVEPHREWGFAYLDAIREVFGRARGRHRDLTPEDLGLSVPRAP